MRFLLQEEGFELMVLEGLKDTRHRSAERTMQALSKQCGHLCSLLLQSEHGRPGGADQDTCYTAQQRFSRKEKL